MVDKFRHGFYEMPERYQSKDQDPLKCFPTCLTTAVKMPDFYLSGHSMSVFLYSKPYPS